MKHRPIIELQNNCNQAPELWHGYSNSWLLWASVYKPLEFISALFFVNRWCLSHSQNKTPETGRSSGSGKGTFCITHRSHRG